MPRDDRGFLKEDALRSGVPEQWATILGPAHHVIEIVWRHDRGYVVRHEVKLNTGETSAFEYTKGSDIAAARHLFRQEVRSLGGRA